MNVIEKVARAMFAVYWDGHSALDNPDYAVSTVRHWEKVGEDGRNEWRDMAKASIQALIDNEWHEHRSLADQDAEARAKIMLKRILTSGSL